MIQKQQEALRKRQEEEARLEAEAKAKAEEDERVAAEEEKRREEAKALKKQKEKERIEQLKKEGKFLTKAQKEEKARNERKLQQMLAAGIKVGPQDDEKPKSKPSYDRKKKGRNQQKVCCVTLHTLCHFTNFHRLMRRRPSLKLLSGQGNKPKRN